MKLIRIKSLSPLPDIDIHPDSAMILPGRPFFLPEWEGDWVARIHPALRICRLGKNISRKFAPRYYDGIGMALRMRPSDLGGLEGVVSGMDATLIHGEWLSPERANEALTVACSGQSAALPPMNDEIADTIVAVSRYMTLKMGDIILLPAIGTPIYIKEGDHLDVRVDGVDNLNLRIV